MHEDFVPYELAVKLKEKGFNTEFKYSLGYYDTLGNFMSAADHWFLDSWIIAPTISQVLKWLREEKKIFVIPSISPRINEEVKWDWDAGCFDNKKIFRWRDGNYGYNSYEQASLAGISWTLDNLI